MAYACYLRVLAFLRALLTGRELPRLTEASPVRALRVLVEEKGRDWERRGDPHALLVVRVHLHPLDVAALGGDEDALDRARRSIRAAMIARWPALGGSDHQFHLSIGRAGPGVKVTPGRPWLDVRTNRTQAGVAPGTIFRKDMPPEFE